MVYTLMVHLIYGWEEDSWKSLVSPSVRSAILEIWCPCLISVVRGHPYAIRHGSAPILIAALTSKSEMVTSISTNLS
jgi:hypothetical protein